MQYTAIIYATKRQQRTIKSHVSSVLTLYPDSALVEVTTQQLDQLTAEGYSIEVLDGINEINVGGELVDTSAAPAAISKSVAGVRGAPMADDFPHHFLVQFIGPIKPEWLQAVEKAGGIPPFAETQRYVVKVRKAWGAAKK